MFNLKSVLKLRAQYYCFCNHKGSLKTYIQDNSLLNEPNLLFRYTLQRQMSTTPTSNKEENVLNQRFARLLEVIDNKDVKNAFMYQRVIMEFREIFKISDEIIHNKQNAMNLIKILVRLRIDIDKIHFIREKNSPSDSFEICEESPDNYMLFSKTWEKVLVKSNIALKCPELMFETVYQVPKAYAENIDMSSFVEGYLNNHSNDLPISIILFFLSKMLVQSKRTVIPNYLINSTFKRYTEIKNNLFNMGMANFVYYQCLSKYYVSIKNLNKWNMAQSITGALEFRFRQTEGINISSLRKESINERQIFYQLIWEDAADYISKFEKGELNISEKFFIESLIFFFKSFSRFSIQHKLLCETVDFYVNKYKEHISLVDKLALLMTYAKYLNVVPSFTPIFEEDLLKALKSLSWELKYKSKTMFVRSILDNAFINKEYYRYLKKNFSPDFKDEDLPPFFGSNDMPPLSINQISEIFWYLGKTATGKQSPELIEISNNLLNLCFSLFTKFQLADTMQSACALSLIAPPDIIDWKKDFEYKMNIFAEKFKGWDPSKTRSVPFYSINSLYKNLTFINLKFGIDAFNYFTPSQIDHLKREWFNSLKRYQSSMAEKKVYEVLSKHFRKNNIKKIIHTNKLVDLHNVDIFIEPDLIIEVNGVVHFPKNSSLEIIKNTFYGNNLIKSSILQEKGYKLVLLNYFDFTDILNDQEKLEAFILQKTLPYL